MKKFVYLMLTLIVSACAHRPIQDTVTGKSQGPLTKAEASFQSSQSVQGLVTFEQQGSKVQAIISVQGLKPNSIHGIHIHQESLCEGPKFESAGDHFNPEGHTHAGPMRKIHHLGDLGNLHTDARGEVRKEVMLTGMEPVMLDQLLNRSVIIHQKADDLKSQPAGNSGERIACGLIRAQ